MNNMFRVIKQHNCKVLSTKNVDRLCNCRNRDSCLLYGKYLQTCIMYKADVITNKDSHIYYGAGKLITKTYFAINITEKTRTLKPYLTSTK